MTATFSEMDMFLARLSLDPPAVEAERYRMPSLTEAPGSPEDRRMRRQRARRAEIFRLTRRPATAFEDQPREQTYKRDPARFVALVEKRRSK